MNNTEQKITPAQISESQENLKAKYELEIEAARQANLKLKKTLTDKDDEIFELQKANERTEQERDEYKLESRRNRRIEQEKKHNKQQNDFKTEFLKLQEQKGWKWSEERGWTR